MLSELRKYGVALVLANQYRDQLTPEIRTSILGNIGTLVVFRVGAGDAMKLARELSADLNPEELTNLRNRSFWLRPLVDGEAIPAFTGETLLVASEPSA
jgi:hypothetical protein